MPLPITALPAAPTRADPANFNSKAEAFAAALTGLVTEINGLSAADFFDVQLSATDATAGRVLRYNGSSGSFGLGSTGIPPTLSDIDVSSAPTGFWRTTNGGGTFPSGVSKFGTLRHERYDASNQSQWYVPVNADEVWTRRYKDTAWGDWRLVFDQASLVGTVSETGGVPTGAVIERGSNANGEYTRWADGTQICTNGNAAITTAPAAFTGTITKIDGDKLWVGTWF